MRDYKADNDEVCFEADFLLKKINGWNIGQIGQTLGQQARDSIKTEYKIVKAKLRLCLWIEKESPDAGKEEGK